MILSKFQSFSLHPILRALAGKCKPRYNCLVKFAIRVAAPPPKPVVIYDGECMFCCFWIRRWQQTTCQAVDYLAFQDGDAAERFPELPPQQLQTALHLVTSDGSVFSGAEAAFRALA